MFKIKRKDSPNCAFCNTTPETYIHLFVECPVVKPVWEKTIIKVIVEKIKQALNPTVLEKIKMVLTMTNFLRICFFYLNIIFICKLPSFEGCKTYTVSNKDLEYSIAKKNNKLVLHFKKWKFKL